MLRYLLAACLILVASESMAVSLVFTGTYGTTAPNDYPNPQLAAQSATLTPSPNNGSGGVQSWSTTIKIGPDVDDTCTWTVYRADLGNGMYRWHGALTDKSGKCIIQASVDNASSSPNANGTHTGSAPNSSATLGCGPGAWAIGP